MKKFTKRDTAFLLQFALVRGGKTAAQAAKELRKPYNTVRRWLTGEAEPLFSDGANLIRVSGADYDEVLTIKERAQAAREEVQ